MTAAIIHATSRPLVGLAAIDNPPPVVPLPTLNDISATTSFNIPLAVGSLLVAPTNAMTAGSTYTITPNDGRVAVQGGAFVRGPATWTTAGSTVFTIVETYTGATGASTSRTSTLTVTAVAPVVVVPGFATVVDAVGRNTRAGVKIGQLPAGASLSGTNATHFDVDALGQVTVSAAGQTAGLASTYNMTVVGGGSVTVMAFNTLANEWTATTALEIEQAAAALKVLTNLDRRIVLPTGTVITPPTIVSGGTTRRNILLQNFMMDGAIVDDNYNLTPQDVKCVGFKQFVGLNGMQDYNPNAVGSVSGGSITIYSPTTLQSGGGAIIDCLFRCIDCRPICFKNLDFRYMSTVDMYDCYAIPPAITRQASATVTSVNSAGAILSVNFTDLGAGYPHGATDGYDAYMVWGSGPGVGFSGYIKTKTDGTVDPSTFKITNAGSGFTTASKIRVGTVRVWDPVQLPGTAIVGQFYQLHIQSTSVKQEDAVARDYSSALIQGCRFGVESRPDLPSLQRYNRTLGVVTIDRLLIEDCLWDGFWVGIGCQKFLRIDYRRNVFMNYFTDIIDTFPCTANIDPVATAATGKQTRYTDLAAPFRPGALMFATGNYIDPPNYSSTLFSNTHADAHQFGGGGDLLKQNILYASNIVNMTCPSTYVTTQGVLQNGDSAQEMWGTVAYNFVSVSTTNAIMWANTKAVGGVVFHNNFCTRSVFGEVNDLGGGVDGIGGGIITVKAYRGHVITRNVIKEVWDIYGGDGGFVYADPAGGVMTKYLQPTVPRNAGPVYISDNFFLSCLTPNTGAGTSYPEVFKGVNAAGTTGAFIWNPTLGISGPATGKPAIGFHRWWEKVRRTPASRSFADRMAAAATAQADIKSIFTPLAGSGADGRHCFPAEAF